MRAAAAIVAIGRPTKMTVARTLANGSHSKRTFRFELATQSTMKVIEHKRAGRKSDRPCFVSRFCVELVIVGKGRR